MTFSVARTDADFTLLRGGSEELAVAQREGLLDTARMKISGLHNVANALAALALGEAAGLPMPPCCGRSRPFRA